MSWYRYTEEFGPGYNHLKDKADVYFEEMATKFYEAYDALNKLKDFTFYTLMIHDNDKANTVIGVHYYVKVPAQLEGPDPIKNILYDDPIIKEFTALVKAPDTKKAKYLVGDIS